MLANVLGRLVTSLNDLPEQKDLTIGQRLLDEALSEWRGLLHEAQAFPQLGVFIERYDGAALEEALDLVAQAQDDAARFQAARILATSLVAFIEASDEGVEFDNMNEYRSWKATARDALVSAGTISQVAVRMVHAESLNAVSEEAARRASESASEAGQAAGLTGDASLASWFDAYGKTEHRASSFFRGLAFFGLAGTAGLAWWFFLESEKQSFAVSSIIFRSAILLAVAAFSSYAIRLAGQHRQQGNWGKSIAVQLKSFQAFIRPVADGATKDSIYEHFARRILGDSPSTTGDKNEANLSLTAQDLISLLPKQS